MKHHIAFLPSSGMGHILPLFHLAEKLILHHGFHVSFLVITTNASAAQTQFLRSPTVRLLQPDLSVINLPPVDVSVVVTADMRLATQISVLTRESLKPLKATLIDLNPTSLIIDIFTTDAIDVCRELSIPVYSFFTASTALLTFSLYLPASVEGDYADVDVPGCRRIRATDIVDPVRERENDDYKWYLLHVSRLRNTAGIILNVWEGFDPDRFKVLNQNPFYKSIPTPPVHPVGPLVKEAEILPENDARILAWLDSQPRESVLYVCFGSGGTLSSEQLTELAWGLEASRQRFILVARRPVDSSVSAVYFSVGDDKFEASDYLPVGFLERTRGVGMVVHDWAPQSAVLRHLSTGAFLSHCGWNSVLESVVEGVPIIAWPLFAEQRMNAAMLVEEVGVAVKVAEVGEEVVGREEVERVVREVMEGGEEGKAIRRRARELRETAKMALGDGGSRILHFVDS